MEAQLYCNSCFLRFNTNDRAVTTACSHLLCFDCTKRTLTTDSSCPVCQSVITKSTIKPINVLLDPEDNSLKQLLFGQHPAAAMSAAMACIEHYNQQQQFYSERKISHLEQKNAKITEACRNKLGELHQAYASAKRKYDEMCAKKQVLDADHQELQDKYSQKATETKKLRENIQALVTSKDELQRTCERLARRVGVSPASLAVPPPPPPPHHHHHGNTNTDTNNVMGGGNRPHSGQGGGSFHPHHQSSAGGMHGGTFQDPRVNRSHNNSMMHMNNNLGPAQRGRLLNNTVPSPLQSPAVFNPNAMSFDFQTPTNLPQPVANITVPRQNTNMVGGGGSGGGMHQHGSMNNTNNNNQKFSRPAVSAGDTHLPDFLTGGRPSSRGGGGGHSGGGPPRPAYSDLGF